MLHISFLVSDCYKALERSKGLLNYYFLSAPFGLICGLNVFGLKLKPNALK